MGAPKPADERKAVVAAYFAARDGGLGYKAALSKVAADLRVGQATVGRYVRALREHGSLAPRLPARKGTPRLLTPEHAAVLAGWALAAPETTTYALQQRVRVELGVSVSEGTVQRTLAREGVRKRQVLKAKRLKGEGSPLKRTGFKPQHRRPAIPKAGRGGYPSDVTNAEWAELEPLLLARKVRAPRKYTLRDVLDAVLYQTRTGCAWRYLPRDLPPWQTVLRCLTSWRRNGVLDHVHDALRTAVRASVGKSSEPTVAIIDSQTVKSAGGREQVGYDGAKKTKGRKRHILVDSLGLLLALVVHAADIQDRDGGHLLVNQALVAAHPELKVVYADAGYAGPKFERTVNGSLPVKVEIVHRPHGSTAGDWRNEDEPVEPVKPSFQVVRKRWIVERTLGWMPRWRRLARDYELTAESSRSRVLVAMIHRMTARLHALDPG